MIKANNVKSKNMGPQKLTWSLIGTIIMILGVAAVLLLKRLLEWE